MRFGINLSPTKPYLHDKGSYVLGGVCFSVCEQHYSKSYKFVAMIPQLEQIAISYFMEVSWFANEQNIKFW